MLINNLKKLCLIAFAIILFLGIAYVHKDNIIYTNAAALNREVIHIKNYFDNKKNINCINEIGKDIPYENIDYNFFVAGHAYGNPYSDNIGIHPRFYKYLSNNHKKYDFAIFAGDITRSSNIKSWKIFKREMDLLNIKKYYVAPGNHDIGINSKKNMIFKEYFNEVNYSFTFRNDVFIIINGYENEWSVKGKQLDFLVDTIKKNESIADNIFIITHPVIFYRDNFGIRVNSFDGKGAKLNFWETVFPILNKFKKNFFVIAGDLGAHVGQEIFCRKINNTYLVTKCIFDVLDFFVNKFLSLKVILQ